MTLVIAHRGASAHRRENTIEAFELARELGADWVELDVRRTGDGVMVVHHDAHLDDGRALVDLSAEDLPDHVPTLAAALEACSGMGVNVEIKNLPHDPDYDAEHTVSVAVAGLVRAFLEPADVIVSSFNMDAIDRIREEDPELPTGFLSFHALDPAQLVDWVASRGHRAIHPHVSAVDRPLVERAHAAGLSVVVWTADEPERIGHLLDLEVDGIITNRPDVARQVRDSRLGR